MNNLPGDGAPAPSKAMLGLRSGLVRIEYAVSTKADSATAWHIFTDWQYWSRISNRYKEVRWHGRPWVPGSRLHVELRRPVEAVVDRVITVCQPAVHVAWINHVLGYTMEQWVFFQPAARGGTRVFTWLEFTGPGETFQGRSVQELIENYIEEWYEQFRLECDRAAQAAENQPRQES
jgi:hypothetical protein